MRGSLVVALLVCTALLAGCGGSSFDEHTDNTVPAGALMLKALANGKAWNANARLVQVGAREVSAKANDTSDVQKARSSSKLFAAQVPGADATMGDGKARAWGFDFVAGTNQHLGIVLAPSGEVTYRSEDTSLYSSIAARKDLGNFSIDSDGAAGLAAAKQPGFANLRPDALSGSIVLAPSDKANRTDWQLTLFGEDDKGIAQSIVVLVDSRSGDVRLLAAAGNKTQAPKVAPPAKEAGTISGTVGNGNSDSQTFTLLHTHNNLTVLLTLVNAQPASQVTASVNAPDGQSKSLTASNLPLFLGGGQSRVVFKPGPNGDYTVNVSLQTGVSQEYSLAYCTGEPGTPPGGDNPAC